MWLAATDLPRLQLCGACSGFFADNIGRSTSKDIHRSLWEEDSEYVCTRTRGEVEREAISGCVFCDSVFDDRLYTDVLGKNPSYSGAVQGKRVRLHVRNEVRHPGFPPADEQLEVRIKRELSASSLSITYRAKNVVQREAYIMSPGSPELLHQAREWMNDCLANHTGCGQGGSTKLPARVVLLSAPGEPPWAKVWEPNGQDGQYCALSYCWGRDQEHKLLASRHQMYYTQGLPYAKLPKTITDAFHIARSVGMRYIWIDSLCIVQDDREDKEREMANMMNIYRNATFTISAASASNATEGIFRTPNQLRIERGPYYHPVRTSEGQTGSVVFARIARYVAAEPINNRGWTFQESLLTPRLLIFTELMMAWKCHKGFQPSHLAPNGRNMLERRPSAGAWGNWFKHLGYTSVRLGVADGQPNPAATNNTNRPEEESDLDSQVLKLWHTIVEKYTRRSLSEDRDRLPALSAIAQALKPRFQCQYHAGLWARFLVLELTWNVVPECSGPPSFKPTALGPSWSWASVVGACCDYRHSWMHNLRAEVVSCQTTLVSEDNSYGEVAAGELVLRGYLRSGGRLAVKQRSQLYEFLGFAAGLRSSD
ncbi:heterokaryon incompatibility protein [Apiospora marii]|uniref:Heterokaryon incompatibility protein n=1 Tax=Apiospora marii TaxID=335849 RepID=A0ABR1RVA0_9PEZI